MKKLLKTLKQPQYLVAVVLVLIGCGYLFRKPLLVRINAGADFNFQPYIAENIHFYVKYNREIRTALEITSRRRDGATFRTATFYLPDGRQNGRFSRIDLPDGYTAMMMDAIGAKSSGKRPARDTANANGVDINPANQCAQAARPEANFPGDVVEGREMLFRHEAVRIVRTEMDGMNRLVSWRLLDMGCLEVQSLLQVRKSSTDEWQTDCGRRLVAFVESDPDPMLFTKSDSYKEMTPSDLKRAIYKNAGVTPEKCRECFADDTEADTLYRQWNEKDNTKNGTL